jgi:hypothetical protein
MERSVAGWFYQFVCCKFAILVSVDYRCENGHLIHLKTLTFDHTRIVWC